MTLDRILEALQYETQRTADSTKEQLISKIEFAQRELQRALDALKQDNRVSNPIGILQSLGSDIDRLAGTYHAQQEATKMVLLHSRWIKEELSKNTKEA